MKYLCIPILELIFVKDVYYFVEKNHKVTFKYKMQNRY